MYFKIFFLCAMILQTSLCIVMNDQNAQRMQPDPRTILYIMDIGQRYGFDPVAIRSFVRSYEENPDQGVPSSFLRALRDAQNARAFRELQDQNQDQDQDQDVVDGMPHLPNLEMPIDQGNNVRQTGGIRDQFGQSRANQSLAREFNELRHGTVPRVQTNNGRITRRGNSRRGNGHR